MLRAATKTADGVHDLLLRVGDLTREEIQARSSMSDAATAIVGLEQAARIVAIHVAGEQVYRGGRRGALPGCTWGDVTGRSPPALLEPVRDPAGDLALRFGRTHGPFTRDTLARRFGLGTAIVESLLARLTESGRLMHGEFRPAGSNASGSTRTYCDDSRSRSLARLRREVEPVSPDALGRFLVVAWHRLGTAWARSSPRCR